MNRRAIVLSAVAAATAAAAGVVAYLRSSERHATEELGPSGVVDTTAESRRGSEEDRGKTAAYALDVDRLKSRSDLEPAVQYLTFIQSQRGEDSHLLFVRYEDIDAMAALEGDSVPGFLERLDQLGVVVSTN